MSKIIGCFSLGGIVGQIFNVLSNQGIHPQQEFHLLTVAVYVVAVAICFTPSRGTKA